MADLAPMIRQRAESQMNKLATGQLVGDEERRKMTETANAQAQSGLAEQQKMVNRQSMAATSGGPMQSQYQQQVMAAQKAGASAAVKAGGQTEMAAKKLEELRGQQALALGKYQVAQDQQIVKMATEFAMRGAEVSADVFSNMYGGGMA